MLKITVVVLALLFAVASSDKPIDLPCVTWEPLTSSETTDPTDLFRAAYTWVMSDGYGNCVLEGDIFPCFASDEGINTWGHHDYQDPEIPSDYCRTYNEGSVYKSNNMYVPKKGPKWQTWKWVLTQTGGKVPDNAIRFGSSVMARSTMNAPGHCCGKGFTGWAVGNENGTFGDVHFTIIDAPVTTTNFEVAVCEAYHPTPTPMPNPPSNEPTTTTAPEPTLPPNTHPYVRFGHAVPAPNHVDAVITQGNISYTWSNYAFGEFSNWFQKFVSGSGVVDVYENVNGTRGKLLVTTEIPLTPGPLVVVIKDYWPPTVASNVETIAASYAPIYSGSGVRLFNLSPDTQSAGLKFNGRLAIDSVLYTLGSTWSIIPHESGTFTAFDDNTNAIIATDITTPPEAPFVFTQFLIGLQNTTKGSPFATMMVPLIDAPEMD